jgi:NhaP-type Na+/H+ or K+/H+ antiporter
VFALNILAFIFIGLQIRPILDNLEAKDRARYFAVATAVLLTVIIVRLAWHMSSMQSSGGETAGSVFGRPGRCCGRLSGAA